MWNEPDGANRAEQAQALWAADGRLVDVHHDETAIGFFGDVEAAA